jgi:hypothetical protein
LGDEFSKRGFRIAADHFSLFVRSPVKFAMQIGFGLLAAVVAILPSMQFPPF